jgi:hypothetical protein
MSGVHKIGNRVEELFAVAAGLSQTGRMKSTIYCVGNRILILNSDDSMIIEFLLREGESPFKTPVCFKADDYDGREFREEDGFIHFVSREGGWVKDVASKVPGKTPEQVGALFDGYATRAADALDKQDIHFALDAGLNSLLNPDLSHVEFLTDKDKKLIILQRNIYSGSIIRVERDASRGFGVSGSGIQDSIPVPFNPFGLRTPDYLALFAFVSNVMFSVCDPDNGSLVWIQSMDPRIEMSGVIGGCKYDSLGVVRQALEEESDGRQE